MSKVKFFFILSGYQLTWLMCVFGEIFYKSFFPGLTCGLIFLFLVFIKTQNKRKFIFIEMKLFKDYCQYYGRPYLQNKSLLRRH